MRFSDKVAIVTGAAGAGIGQATVRRLAQEGANVVVSDAHAKRPFTVAEELSSAFGVKTLGVQCDVSNREQVDNMVKQTLNEFGRIDILVNNAGMDRYSPIVDMTDETWDLVININLKGTFNCIRAVAPTMIKQKSGRIVNISSSIVWVGEVDDCHYCAAKAGVIGLTRALAKELGPHNILVNAVAPGGTPNPFLTKNVPQEVLDKWYKASPFSRPGSPEELAGVIAYLASEDNTWLTGQAISASGGAVMH